MLNHNRSKEALSQSHTGYFPDVLLTMVKKFHVPDDWAGKVVTFEFEGVYSNSMVYINSDYAGGCPHGYTNFYVSAEQFLIPGQENEIKVISKACKDSRWYTGVGIYRNVKIMVGDALHILPDSYRITTPEVDDAGALIEVACTLANKALENRETRIVTILLDDAGDVVAKGEERITAFSHDQETLRQRFYIASPNRWDIDTPYLYTAKTELYVGEELFDKEETHFGIRTLQLDPVNGLRINGKTVKLRGACVHHDNGIIGAATIERAEERRVELLKAAGFNAIRSAHNPISKAFLSACDTHGLVVMDEFSDMWTRSKNDYDYSSAFPYHWEQAVEAMVAKDYNHPSVIMYSIGNEIAETGTAHGAAIGRLLAEKFRNLDKSRYTINSVNLLLAIIDTFAPMMAAKYAGDDKSPEDINAAMTDIGAQLAAISNSEIATTNTLETFGAVDIAGYNYATARYEPDRERFPNRVLCGSETLPSQIAENWKVISENSHVIGDFTWTGWDYLGEAGIARMEYEEDGVGKSNYGQYPWYIAWCGDLDILGNRRPASYYREIVFGLRKEPYITVRRPQNYGKTLIPGMWSFVDGISSWTWTGFEGKPAEVEVFADADKVEIICNGAVVGEAAVVEFKAMIPTTYQPGELEAIAYRDGAEVGRTKLTTAGNELHLNVDVDRSTLHADDTDLSYIMISLTDKNGIVNNMADRKVSVTVEGAGELLGLGSANPKSEESFRDGVFTTFDGYVLAVVRPNNKGVISVAIEAEGLAAQTVRLKAE